MASKVYINGELVDADQAKVSVFDHGLLYGDGVFEGIRCYLGKPFQLQQHIKRLFESAKAIRLTVPQSPEQLAQAVEQTIQANEAGAAYVRLVVTRGAGHLGLNPNRCSNPQVIIIVDQIELYPAELYEHGLEVITASTIRNHPNALPPRIKSLNYLNNILAKIEAVDAGVLEAIMLNHEGFVAEATGDNVFIVYSGRLLTTPTSAGILAGITRQVVIELAGEAGIPLEEKNLTRHDLYTADECFLTGTAAEIIPVSKIDGRIIGDGTVGPITRKLMADFAARTRGNGR